MIHVTKVKYDGSKVHIEYLKTRAGDQLDEFTLTSTDQPKQGFKDALAALSPHVVRICEFKGGDVDVRGCSFTWKDDVFGAVITALKAVDAANSPLVVNTPYLSQKSTSKDDDDGHKQPTLGSPLVKRLETLLEETQRYIKGSRAQGALFEDKE